MKPGACGKGDCPGHIYLWIHGHHSDPEEQRGMYEMKMLIAALASSMLALGSVAQAAQKPTIVLVHGAFEDSQVWGHVTAKLEADGYKVVAVDLPGRSGNPMPPDKVSLDLYRDTVVKALDATNGPAVFVGHSFGGIVIAAAAEEAP